MVILMMRSLSSSSFLRLVPNVYDVKGMSVGTFG